MTQQAQQAYTQKDLQLYEKNAQNAQLRQKIDEFEQKMRNRGNVIAQLKRLLISHEYIIFREIVHYRNCVLF